MYRGLKIHALIPCWNEESRIGHVVERVRKTGIVDKIVVIDDGSTDRSAEVAEKAGASLLKVGYVAGVGAALRLGMRAEADHCDVIVILAGNNKDEPLEIPRLLDPIVDKKAVFVQGSRYLPGGSAAGDMPGYRRWATRVHPFLFSVCVGKRVSESTNGFRAFRVELLKDPRIRLEQAWLDHYELEPYLYFQTVRLGYPTYEVPVTKTYPPKGQKYTKMPMITGWWSILRPLLLLRLGLRT